MVHSGEQAVGDSEVGKTEGPLGELKEDLRVVLRGWNHLMHWVHPSRALGEFTGAMKVEAVYRRMDGRQGTMIVSFGTASEAKAALPLGCRTDLQRRLYEAFVQQWNKLMFYNQVVATVRAHLGSKSHSKIICVCSSAHTVLLAEYSGANWAQTRQQKQQTTNSK